MQHWLLHYMQHQLLHYMRYWLLYYMQHWSLHSMQHELLHYTQHWLLHYCNSGCYISCNIGCFITFDCLLHFMWSYVNTVIVSSHWSLFLPHSHSVKYIVFNSNDTSFFEVHYLTWIQPSSQVGLNLHTSAGEHSSSSTFKCFNIQVLQHPSSSTFTFFSIFNSHIFIMVPCPSLSNMDFPMLGGI